MLLTKVVALDTFINPNFNIKNLRPVQVYFCGATHFCGDPQETGIGFDFQKFSKCSDFYFFNAGRSEIKNKGQFEKF